MYGSLYVENQMDRMQYWLSSVRALYLEPQAEELLFYENDLRLMADIIVRVIETVTEGTWNLIKETSWRNHFNAT